MIQFAVPATPDFIYKLDTGLAVLFLTIQNAIPVQRCLIKAPKVAADKQHTFDTGIKKRPFISVSKIVSQFQKISY